MSSLTLLRRSVSKLRSVTRSDVLQNGQWRFSASTTDSRHQCLSTVCTPPRAVSVTQQAQGLFVDYDVRVHQASLIPIRTLASKGRKNEDKSDDNEAAAVESTTTSATKSVKSKKDASSDDLGQMKANSSVPEEEESIQKSINLTTATTTTEVSTSSSVPDAPQKPRLDKLYKTIELELLAYEPAVTESYKWFVVTAANHLGITVGKMWAPFKSDKWRFALLKSAFVHKKHQVHYEVRTYHQFIHLHKLTESTADTFLEYIERNLPEGIGLKVTKVEMVALPEYLRQRPTVTVEAQS